MKQRMANAPDPADVPLPDRSLRQDARNRPKSTRVASKTLIEFIDDLDGSPASETVTFAIDGVTYEIDLSETHAAQLRGRHPLDRGTCTTTTPAPAPQRTPAAKRDLAAIRGWAKDNGHKVSDRGRISQAVLDAYDAAN